MQLAEILDALAGLPPDERQAVEREIAAETATMRFVPLPGPQTEAYLSPADVLLYGGAAGGGKSYLLMGLSSQEHKRSIVFRRELGQTDGLEEAGRQIIGDTARFAGSPTPEWVWEDGRALKLAGIKEPGDWMKHAGRERDFIGFDEAGEFLAEQVASLMAWNRGPLGQRCRVVLASNPPRSTDGAWMFEWFAPWLDHTHPDPAKPGELRWAVMVKGSPVWVDGPDEVMIDGEPYRPLSFTFVPASLKDNPYRDTPEYRARLNSLPEPLRSQLLKGLFALGGEDDPWQCIPTAWIQAAVMRWTESPPAGVPMSAMGVDVAQGGADNTVIARRHDGWFGPLLSEPGHKTPGGTDVAGLVIAKRYDGAKVIIDVGGGWGADAHGHLMGSNIDSLAYMGVKSTLLRSADRQFGFANTRSAAYWRFREALNPDQRGGSRIALPDDKQLISQLASPRYRVKSDGGGPGGIIELEAKEKLVARLGKSPDKADAVVMAWWAGPKIETDWHNWPASQGNRFNNPRVISGRAPQTARRSN